jgi:hypothetical protein
LLAVLQSKATAAVTNRFGEISTGIRAMTYRRDSSSVQAESNNSEETTMTPGLRNIHRFLFISAVCLLGLGLFPMGAFASYNYPFPDDATQFPSLPQTAVGPAIPANPGWIVSRVNNTPNIYWVTDGNYQAMFIVMPSGVTVVDAPEPLPFFPPLPVIEAVRSVTSLPITRLIYSHAHTDHIGGAGAIKAAFPNVQIIAQEETKRILQSENDPRRPVPTQTFRDHAVLDVGGGAQLELSYFGPIHFSWLGSV